MVFDVDHRHSVCLQEGVIILSILEGFFMEIPSHCNYRGKGCPFMHNQRASFFFFLSLLHVIMFALNSL